MISRSLACCTLAALCLPASAAAQQITVQQPAFRFFSVNTTVSAPDRGAAYLGSVARAADSRSRFGPLRTTSGLGTAREHAGMHVAVRIHDFDEMDRLLLGQSAGARGDRSPVLTGDAAHSYRSLMARERRTEPARPPALATSAPDSFSRADHHDRLGREAEERGSASVARLHYRTAARHGSASARERLERLETAAVAHR